MVLNDWFEWNGVMSTVYGIHVITQPGISFPDEKIEFSEVPGRNGALGIRFGDSVFSDQNLSIQCFADDINDLKAFSSYLRGTGKLRLASRPNGYFKATLVDAINFSQLNPDETYQGLTVNFRLEPFLYSLSDVPVTLVNNPSTILNPGDVYCQPKFTIHCTGNVTVVINGETIDITGTSNSTDTSLVIDSEAQECMNVDETAFVNSRVSLDEFPVLDPGTNEISWSGEGTVTDIVVLRRSRSR